MGFWSLSMQDWCTVCVCVLFSNLGKKPLGINMGNYKSKRWIPRSNHESIGPHMRLRLHRQKRHQFQYSLHIESDAAHRNHAKIIIWWYKTEAHWIYSMEPHCCSRLNQNCPCPEPKADYRISYNCAAKRRTPDGTLANLLCRCVLTGERVNNI